ncbi:MAG: hypothetical protein HY748_14840 [Elusimicrobia bacterium]|nr:hypothetical protein [Elusimicrobiota bacterium]
MKTTILLTLLLTGTVQPARAATDTVKASWQQYFYGGPNYKRYECLAAKDALVDFLSVIGAKSVRADCSWTWGLSASWETLAPYKQNKSRESVDGLLSGESASALLPGVSRAWRSLAADPAPIDARWQPASLQRFMSDLRQCNIYVSVLDYLFDNQPVRSGNQTVFCRTGSSYVNYQFQYLEPLNQTPTR